jgi:hypothetical protein
MTSTLSVEKKAEHPSVACAPRTHIVACDTAAHHHHCDCDDCLNGPGGLVLPGCGRTVPTELAGVGEMARELEEARKRVQADRQRARRAAAKGAP